MTWPKLKPIARKSFGEILAGMARFNPKGIAVTCGNTTITWQGLNERVNSLAGALKGLGIKKGDHAAILFHDCPEFIEANYALQKLGAVPIPINFRFVAREIEYQLTHSDSTVLIFEDLFLDETGKALKNCPAIRQTICLARDGRPVPEGMLDYEAAIASHPAIEPPACTTAEDVCTICYTGGTTGRPKGVVLTYSNFWNLAQSLFGDLIGRLACDEKVNFGRIIASLVHKPWLEAPLNRLMGFPKVRSFVSQNAPALLAKTTGKAISPLLGRLIRFILREGIHFDPAEVLETIARERPMVVLLVPTQWKMILDYPDIDRYDRRSVLVAMTGAGANPGSRKKQILEKFSNSIVVDVFGQTEMTPDTALRIDTSPETIKNKSVGRPLSGIKMRIVNEKGEDVPPGSTGEILYQSGTIMKGYYGEAEKTSEVIKDGWFLSGDLGYMDADGELIVVDRKGECISTGAEKVFPHEVEEIMALHEMIDSVCVIGVPDDTWGNIVRAVVVLKPGMATSEQEIISWCKDKMTGFKRPKSVVFADAFPMSPVGKVLRNKVREDYGKPLSPAL